jgi:hypothetical protein
VDISAPGDEPLDVDALLTWVNAPRWPEPAAMLTARPDLLSERAVAELHRQGAVPLRATQVLTVDDHAGPLRLCQEDGVADGYVRYRDAVDRALVQRRTRDDLDGRNRLAELATADQGRGLLLKVLRPSEAAP